MASTAAAASPRAPGGSFNVSQLPSPPNDAKKTPPSPGLLGRLLMRFINSPKLTLWSFSAVQCTCAVLQFRYPRAVLTRLMGMSRLIGVTRTRELTATGMYLADSMLLMSAQSLGLAFLSSSAAWSGTAAPTLQGLSVTSFYSWSMAVTKLFLSRNGRWSKWLVFLALVDTVWGCITLMCYLAHKKVLQQPHSRLTCLETTK